MHIPRTASRLYDLLESQEDGCPHDPLASYRDRTIAFILRRNTNESN
jgi:hypothetical protein